MPSSETLKLFAILFIMASVYLFASYDDYHKEFDKQNTFEYNCKVVLSDVLKVPQFVVDECENGRKFVIVKTYQE
jgi:hypothetical protein